MHANAHINAIATAVPEYEVHRFFLQFAQSLLKDDRRKHSVFTRMSDRGGIARRFSCMRPSDDPEGDSIDSRDIFVRGAFPGTATRMDLYEENAPGLAFSAVETVLGDRDPDEITHLIVTTCTGFSAPGIDLDIANRFGLRGSVERTVIGFMGCYAAINALKQARHIVRSEPHAQVLIVNIELCTLHIRETTDLEQLLSFCLWGDGCAASIVSAEPSGLSLDSFHALVAPETRELMSWSVRDDGFDMVLSGKVPSAIHRALGSNLGAILGNKGVSDVDLWAIHPGGKSVLDTVERVMELPDDALDTSRGVLHDNGNMSSATIMFVLARMLDSRRDSQSGCAMAFGPGLTAETMMFHAEGNA